MACADHVYTAFGVGDMSAEEIAQNLRWALCCSDGVLLTDVDGNDEIAANLNDEALVQVSGRTGTGLARDLACGTVTMFGSTGDEVGAGMTGGSIVVRGDAGELAGAGMSGGSLLVLGDIGAHVGLNMTGGCIYVRRQFAPAAAAKTTVTPAAGDIELAAMLAHHTGEYAEGPGVYNEFYDLDAMAQKCLPLTAEFARITADLP